MSTPHVVLGIVDGLHDARAALRAVIEERAMGPATLRPSAAAAHNPDVET